MEKFEKPNISLLSEKSNEEKKFSEMEPSNPSSSSWSQECCYNGKH